MHNVACMIFHKVSLSLTPSLAHLHVSIGAGLLPLTGITRGEEDWVCTVTVSS